MTIPRPYTGYSGNVGTLVPVEPPAQVGLAVYVVGSDSGARFPLPSAGTVTIGRDAGCEIVIDHPMISRRHATIHLGDTLALEDLGSANGTNVGTQRLAPGSRQALAVEQSFRLGSTVMVVHQLRLPTAASATMATPLELLDRVEKTREAFSLIKLRPARAIEGRWMQTILAHRLAPDDRFVPLRGPEVAIFCPGGDAARVDQLLQDCLAELGRWQVTAQSEVRAFADDGLVAAASDFLLAEQVLRTQCGAIIVGDPAMAEVHRVVDRVAPTSVSVLLLGETGVGKDVVASLIHERSPRRDRPLLRINCATLGEALFESELFGHEKGAFTGAVRTKPGLLESAQGGTVFFDELGEMPAASQAKLLRVVEDGAVTRVGGIKSIAVDVRFVAATNRDLEQEVAAGRFRRDLFYRFNTVQIQIPPLRHRQAEIVPLALHFLAEATRRHGLRQLVLAPAALDALRAYDWPGSIRQLRNVVERAALLGRGSVLQPEDLGLSRDGAPAASAPPAEEPAARNDDAAPTVAGPADERARIIAALKACNGNQGRAAALLKMSRRTLVRKLRLYALPRPHGPFPGDAGS